MMEKVMDVLKETKEVRLDLNIEVLEKLDPKYHWLYLLLKFLIKFASVISYYFIAQSVIDFFREIPWR